MELHLHLNVFMGRMFLSASHRLEGRMTGSKCGGLSDCFVKAVKPNGGNPARAIQLVVYKPQHKSHATRDFQCLMRGKTNLSHGSVDKWFIGISVERTSKSVLSPLL